MLEQISSCSRACLLCLWVGGATVAQGAEPVYQERPLSQWLILYDKANEGSPEEAQASAAVRAVGSNAVPYLLKWMADNESALQLPAADAFKILKTNAAGAVPELASMLTGTNQLTATLAGSALGHIGAPALPVLLTGLTHRRFRVGVDAGQALVELGTNARPAIPILLRDLEHPNHFYRERAANILGQLHLEPATVVPALTSALDDESGAARFLAISGLANFGTNAQSAVPALARFLTNVDSGVRRTTTNALRQISRASGF